jgi:AcrR family transcriptional regulator
VSETKQRLIEAAIACIERKGIQATTSRDIAAEAGANVAALNYHFGSKAALVEVAMGVTVANGMEEFERALLDPSIPFAERLHAFFVASLVGGSRYPNIARAHLFGTIIEGEVPGPYPTRLSALADSALDLVDPAELPGGRQEVARRLEIAIRAVLMRVIGPDLLRIHPPGAAEIHDEARRLVDLVLSR